MSFYRPDHLSDALEIAAQGPGKIVAGGTDLYPSAKQGQRPEFYLDITAVQELRRVRFTQTGTHIGAGVTWSALVAADLPPAFDALKAAALEIGSVQIQNAGTVVGNLCNASPAADGVPALLALDAAVEILSTARGTRIVPLDRFITNVRQTDLAGDEIVTGIRIPPQPGNMRSAFEKLGSRRYLVISICMTAANIACDDQGCIEEARIAVGACSPVAQRLSTLEGRLIGQRPADIEVTPEDLAPLCPINDVRGSAAYRMDVVAEQVARAVRKAAVS
ncbi:FAD binding domain-containing protein [uncultured Roseobacter sp.]|uniref:FAD binding domain-containing protein n=1 Tax=uncultured Roseobacter sp. TaxID=114847 RepID=UPI0026111E1B|nr:FAD binding domain-containing protein [uncultured Roseobacter sp.]